MESENMQDFLKKVDAIGDIIKDFNSTDEAVKDTALQKADKYLENVNKNDGKIISSRTVINQREEKSEMDKDEFMKYIEKDVDARKKRRNEYMKEAIEWKNKGNQYIKEKRYNKAEESYTKAIQLIPDNVVFYSNRAQAYLYLKEYENAIQDCELGLKIDSNFIKCLVRKGKALVALYRFDEAATTFKDILKVDKNMKNMVNGYIQEVNDSKEKKHAEDKVLEKLNSDSAFEEIRSTLKILDSEKDLDVILSCMAQLKQSLNTYDEKLLFSMENGFDYLEKLWMEKSSYKIHNKEKLMINISKLLYQSCIDCERNSTIYCQKEMLLSDYISSLISITNVDLLLEMVTLFYTVSQYKEPRKILVHHSNIEKFVDVIFGIIEAGREDSSSFYSIGILNHLSLEDKFVKKFGKILSEKFVNSVLLLMELISFSTQSGNSLKRFIIIINTSIGTLSNLYRNHEIRRHSDILKIWKTSLKFMSSFIGDIQASHEILYTTLGMLMNLSVDQLILDKALVDDTVLLLKTLFQQENNDITERCCGVLNRIIGNNEYLLKAIYENEVDTCVLKVLLKGECNKESPTIKYISKCLALFSKDVHVVLKKEKIYVEVLPALLEILTSDDENVVGNIAVMFENISKLETMVKSLENKQLIKKLLTQATNEQLSKQVRYNCAVAISKYSVSHQRYLEELRQLHGLEILHEVLQAKT